MHPSAVSKRFRRSPQLPEKHSKKGWTHESVLTTFLCDQPQSWALIQPAPPPRLKQPAASSGEIPEVVVTATRRTENLQNVPIAITALTGETLAQLNVQTFDDFVKYLPNVSTASKGPGQNEIYMRGLSTTQGGNQGGGGINSFPNVAVYLDDQSAQLPGRNLDIYAADLERIEVLEGPQGTLYGAGAQAGAVRYITNKPKTQRHRSRIQRQLFHHRPWRSRAAAWRLTSTCR